MKNGTQRIGRVLALAAAIVGLAAPVAWAAPVEQILSENAGSTMSNTQEQSSNTQGQSYSSLSSIAPYVPETSPTSAPVSVSGEGFDWGDAGIGATVMLALAAMAGGAALVLRNRPHRGSIA